MRVLVIGAGPGGAAAAIELARGGASVRLAERARWPRPKTCGDGISPPGVAEAAALGVSLEDRYRLPEGEISTPGGVRFRGGWRPETPWGAIVPRLEFDARLVRVACAAGADFVDGTAARGVERGDGRTGPRAALGGAPRERYDAVVLAEGATGGLAAAAGFGKHASRLVALRGYADAARPLPAAFGLHFDRPLSPGYGWIFPLDERRANVGVLVHERARTAGPRLRATLASWLRASPAARELLPERVALEGVHGGVIPAARPRRVGGGVYLVGDAAGVADPFSAEGIMQAMASGRAAAAALLAHGGGERAERAYQRSLRPFDTNAREATRLRLGFGFVIDPLARRALERPALAHHLSANGFFMKASLGAFLSGIARAW